MNRATESAMDLDAMRDQAYHGLRLAAANHPNGEWLARMLASRTVGFGSMPERLGLTVRQFASMVAYHFPGMDPRDLEGGPAMDIERAAECADLRTLLLAHTADAAPERVWIADILVAGCMGADHLWQDLGLWSRQDLSAVIAQNFPGIKAKNDRDMKWKKFFYKQLCIQDGIYTCRAPSCEVCADFKNCFGPE